MSNNIEEARRSLDRKLADMGYQHPTTDNQNRNIYKTYKESGDDTYVSQEYTRYATFNANEQKEIEKPENDICPLCDTKALYRCGCEIGEMMCKQNHMWYYTMQGEVKIGDPHVS